MRIIIENAATLEFLTTEGRWTKDAGRAAQFANSGAAMVRGATLPIGVFNVVGSFKGWPQLTNLDEGRGIGATAR